MAILVRYYVEKNRTFAFQIFHSNNCWKFTVGYLAQPGVTVEKLKVVIMCLVQCGPKNCLLFRVDDFVMVSGIKACDMSTVCTFCLEKCVKLACQSCI